MPPLPYIAKLHGKLEAGQTLHVHGQVREDTCRFSINLLQGSANIESCTAVVLHFDARFDEKKIVLNTLEGGQWGKEERHKNPFTRGENFDIKVRAHDDKFEIAANNVEVAEYKHRLPLLNADYLMIQGEISLDKVYWGGRYYTLPTSLQFVNGFLSHGQRVHVHGIPKDKRFSIDFLARNGDILFHFNPRLKEKQIVRNAYLNGAWGDEEREGPFPFKKEHNFALEFHNEPYSWQVICDGKRVGTFAHRTNDPSSDYYGIKIDGEVELTDLQIQEHLSDH